jgi:hypothetical protein
MAGLLYYFPEIKNLPDSKRDLIPKECKLESILNDAHWTIGYCGEFLDGSAGSLISIHPSRESTGKEALTALQANKQKWTKVENHVEGTLKTTHWIGYELDNPPKPADLIRDKPLAGSPVMLNGQEWLVPCVHAPIGCTLPRVFRMTPDGVQAEFDRRYQDIMSQSAIWWENLGKGNWLLKDAFNFTAGVLNTNYRVGAWEMSADCLNLIGSEDLERLIMAACGVLAVYEEELLKKKAAEAIQ